MSCTSARRPGRFGSPPATARMGSSCGPRRFHAPMPFREAMKLAEVHGRSGHGGGKPTGSRRSGSGEMSPYGWRRSRLRVQTMRLSPSATRRTDGLGDAGVDGDGAEAKPAILHAAKAHLLHEGGQGGRGDEAIHRLRQVGVRLAVAAHDGADPRNDVMEIGAEEGGPAREIRLRDLESDHATARARDAAHLAQPLAEITEVAEEEGRGDEGEGAWLEGQGEGIRLHEANAGRRLLRAAFESRDGEHAVGEVGAHQRTVPVD